MTDEIPTAQQFDALVAQIQSGEITYGDIRGAATDYKAQQERENSIYNAPGEGGKDLTKPQQTMDQMQQATVQDYASSGFNKKAPSVQDFELFAAKAKSGLEAF